jgi:hypothetical protein
LQCTVNVPAAYSCHCEVEVEADNKLEAGHMVIEMDYNGELVLKWVSAIRHSNSML